jgi:hypothetical protein
VKTTIDIPDRVFRQLKARAALKGTTMRAIVLQAIREKLRLDLADRVEEPGWRGVFGKASRDAVEEVQTIVDKEFSEIDPEGWE